jgi:hypothetical protein
MNYLQERVMLTADANGKLTRAVLQRQVDEPVLFHDAINYEDVRELPVSPDGIVTLGMTPESEENK